MSNLEKLKRIEKLISEIDFKINEFPNDVCKRDSEKSLQYANSYIRIAINHLERL
jgi:hypothetical protein